VVGAYTDEVEIDELAETLDRVAASRHAQASPDLTTLEGELSDELESLMWRRRVVDLRISADS
jgi:hypothetical protein